MSFLRPKKTIEEAEEETEQLEVEDRKAGVELSIAQKRVAAAELKKRGLEPKHFNFNFRKIITWLKTH